MASLELLHIVDQKDSTVPGTPTPALGDNLRVLNTVKTNEIVGASLSSNQVTLPAGTYFLDVLTHIRRASGNRLTKTIWYNTSDSAPEVIGMANHVAGTNTSRTRGRFTISAEKVFELRTHYSASSIAEDFGEPTDDGTVEVFINLMIWKVS